ncbi:MAG: heavy metal translocating P-type ATPase, partial [archaeon]|nr:heavy metal translocating P-type ATPase [archaeon]
MRHVYGIEIDCANCARSVEESIAALKEVKSVTISFVDKKMFLEVVDESRFEEIEELVRRTAHDAEEEFMMWPYDDEEAAKPEEKKDYMIPRILIGIVFVAIGLLMEYDVVEVDIDSNILRVVYLIGLLIVGYNVLINAFKNLYKARFLDENFLMTVATLGALIIGEWTESVAVMVFYQIGEAF